VVWLKNHGIRIEERFPSGAVRVRFVRPDGVVSIQEAAGILETYALKVYRLVRRRQMKTVKCQGKIMVPLSEVKRLRREDGWRDDWRVVQKAARGG